MKINVDFIKKIGKDKLILIILAGVVLIVCTLWESNDSVSDNSNKDTVTNSSDNKDYSNESYIKSMEIKLKEVLSQIDGVGELYVMITVKNSSSKNVLKENNISYEDTNEEDSSGGKRKKYTYSEDNKTVYVTDSSGNTTPYVISEMSPEIEGVAVIAEGGDKVLVKEKIINIIKALFGIDINKISVTK